MQTLQAQLKPEVALNGYTLTVPTGHDLAKEDWQMLLKAQAPGAIEVWSGVLTSQKNAAHTCPDDGPAVLRQPLNVPAQILPLGLTSPVCAKLHASRPFMPMKEMALGSEGDCPTASV